MIIGLGSDVVNIERIAEQLESFGERFKKKYFTEHEVQAAEKYSDKNKISAHFAKRFAAKEAFSKACGTGFGKYLSFSDIGIENDESGRPVIVTNEKANKLLKELTGGKMPICHVSLSDDQPYAVAVVIIEML